MRGPIMSRGRSQLLCQEGTSQTNLIWLSPSFSFPSPSRSLSSNPDSFSAEWVFLRSFEGQRKTLKRGASLGLWPLIATPRPPSPAALSSVSHIDGAISPNQKDDTLRRSRRQVGWQPGSDKRRVVQRWRGTMGQFERRRWGELSPHNK